MVDEFIYDIARWKPVPFIFRSPPEEDESPIPEKLCGNCQEQLPVNEFYLHKMRDGSRRAYGACKECIRARLQSSEAKARRNAANAKYAAANKEKIREKNRRYNPIAKRRAQERRKIDPNFQLSGALRRRITSALHGRQKSARTKELLGCTVEYLKKWLEYQFSDGMSWKNYGSLWEVDHVRPCISFDLTDPKQQLVCFSWKNLRPMEPSTNRSKNKYVDQDTLDAHETVLNSWFEQESANDQ